MAITYHFKDSRDSRGNGYSGFIENGQLVLEHDDPRSGGTYFRGSYEEAVTAGHIRSLKTKDVRLYNDIEKYFIKHGVEDDTDKWATEDIVKYQVKQGVRVNSEDLEKRYNFDAETKTILYKVRLFMDNREVHTVMVRGRFQADVIKKLMPPISEVLTLQTCAGEVFAVRSGKISAVEFTED